MTADEGDDPVCGIMCSDAYFRGYFHILLHIIYKFKLSIGYLLSYCKKQKNKKHTSFSPDFSFLFRISGNPEISGNVASLDDDDDDDCWLYRSIHDDDDVCVCVLANVNWGHPWVLLQATGHTFHTGHMPVCSKWLNNAKWAIYRP